MAPRDYARLHWDWPDDAVIDAIADVEPIVFAVWPVLVAWSKRASDAEDNPLGILSLTWPKLAAKLRRSVDEVARCMGLLVEGELIEIEDGRLGMKHVRLMRFDEWQVARRSKAEQQQKRRDRGAASRGFIAERGVGVGSESVSFTERERETERDQPPSSAVAAVEKPKRKPSTKTVDDPDVVACFNWYVDLWEKHGQLAIDLTTSRANAIRRALKQHGKAKVVACIRGHHSNPWRHDNGLKANDIEVLLRPSNFDVGVEEWAKARGLASSTSASHGQDDIAGMGY